MILGWCALAFAADPLLEGLPGADGVVVTRGEQRWTVAVAGRSVEVAPVRSDADRAALRALVRALVADLDVTPTVPPDALTSRALAALGPRSAASPSPSPSPGPSPSPSRSPSPPKPPAASPSPSPSPPTPPPPPSSASTSAGAVVPRSSPPAALDPSALPPAVPAAAAAAAAPTPAPPAPRETSSSDVPRIEVVPPALPRRPRAGSRAMWMGAELVVREGLGLGPGAAFAVELRDRVGVRASVRPTRAVDVIQEAGLGEVTVDLTATTRADPVWVGFGVGAAGRRYVLAGDVVALHVVPRIGLGSGVVVPFGRWQVEPALGVEIDLLRTRMGWTTATEVLSPLGFRSELRFGSRSKKIEPESDLITPKGELALGGVR